MISPTIGRVVWYHPPGMKIEAQPYPGLICHVHSDTCVNVGGFDHNGVPFKDTSVLLLQEPGTYGNPGGGSWCEWMPYQIGQAKRNEETK